MTFRPNTLRGRLTFWYTGILTAMLALLGATAVVLLDRGLRSNVDDSLSSLANTLATSVRRPSILAPDLEEALQGMLGPEMADRFFQLLDPLGRPDTRLETRNRSRLPLSARALRNAEKGEPTFETIESFGGSRKPYRLLTMPVVVNGSTVNIVQAAMSLENVDAARSGFLLILLSLSPLALAGSGLGGWFLARRALSPVDAMVDAARKIEAEDLSRRIPALSRDDELGRLAAVLNDMLARLQNSFGAVGRFSSDAAHELRTPLTIIKGEIEMALRSASPSAEIRRTLDSCMEEVDRLNSLVENLLLMARMEGKALPTAPKPVNLNQVLQDVAPALTELAARAGNRCTITAPTSVWVKGYDSLLFRLVFDLAENAIKYTPCDGRIDVALQQQEGKAFLEFRDTGPGIRAEQQEHIFDRFFRGDQAREGTGSGLGLALVKSIVQLHSGEIQVSSTPGAGSVFRVTLPLIPDPVSQTNH